MISEINCSSVNFKGAKSLPAGSIARYLKEFNTPKVYDLPVIRKGENTLKPSKLAAGFKNILESIAKLCGRIFH